MFRTISMAAPAPTSWTDSYVPPEYEPVNQYPYLDRNGARAAAYGNRHTFGVQLAFHRARPLTEWMSEWMNLLCSTNQSSELQVHMNPDRYPANGYFDGSMTVLFSSPLSDGFWRATWRDATTQETKQSAIKTRSDFYKILYGVIVDPAFQWALVRGSGKPDYRVYAWEINREA